MKKFDQSLNRKPSIFISYSWNDKDEVDYYQEKLVNVGFEVSRDINKISVYDDIEEFMRTIREHDYVFIYLSEHYLKSENCMFEALELMKDEHYKNRTFTVVSENANIYKLTALIKYKHYWDKQVETLDNELRTIKPSAILTEHYKKIKNISDNIDGFMNDMAKRKNPSKNEAIDVISDLVFGDTDKNTDNADCDLTISITACHYEFLKFAIQDEDMADSLGKMIGVRIIEDKNQLQDFDLPMLECKVVNNKNESKTILTPFIEGDIALKGEAIQGISFGINRFSNSSIKEGQEATFSLQGPIMISLVEAFINNKIKDIYVEVSNGKKYCVSSDQINEVAEYYKEYCSNINDLIDRHNKFFIG